MKIVIQRVLQANVTVAGKSIARIDEGLLVLVGVHQDDTPNDAEYLAGKTAGLRIFEDSSGKMNLSVLDCKSSILAVPQFTLLGNCRRGKRPDFTRAAPPEKGKELYLCFCETLIKAGLDVKQGSFREHMHVQLINNGPVTILLDSKKET
ncbi:D-tyrosyl-tRNA(Tyr) deacylase [bacterium]|nr:D-tyrosyl-tRNA(Tyr) deacylase [bacterium]